LTAKEKRLLTIMLLIFLGYMLPFVIIPAGWGLIKDYQNNIAAVKTDLDRYQKLGEATQVWQEAYEKAQQNLDRVNGALLKGTTRDLVAAQMQGVLQELAKQHQITFRSMAVPEFNTNESWMLVTQTIQFSTDSPKLIAFLKALEAAPAQLIVVSMDIRSERGTNLGVDMKITGFSRLENLNTDVIPAES